MKRHRQSFHRHLAKKLKSKKWLFLALFNAFRFIRLIMDLLSNQRSGILGIARGVRGYSAFYLSFERRVSVNQTQVNPGFQFSSRRIRLVLVVLLISRERISQVASAIEPRNFSNAVSIQKCLDPVLCPRFAQTRSANSGQKQNESTSPTFSSERR